MELLLKTKVKQKIVNDLNQDLYNQLNLSLYEADHYFGYYNGYIYKLIEKVYEKYGPVGLRSEIQYIVQYLIFLFNKLESNSMLQDSILVILYFKIYYRHFSQRRKINFNQLSFNF